MKTKAFHIVSATLLAAVSACAQPVRYTVTDLGPVGGPPGQPFVVRNNGLVSGAASVTKTTWHAVLWYQGARIDIAQPGLGGSNSGAFGVNERGQAVGQAQTPNADPNHEDFCGFGAEFTCLPFVWQYGMMIPLPTLVDKSGAAGRNGAANAINNRGQVVGTSENTVRDSTCGPPNLTGPNQLFQFKPVIWENGAVRELPTVGGDPDGIVFAINDEGQAVGASGTCTSFQANGDLTYLFGNHVLLWDTGSVVDLGNLGGVAPGGGNGAIGINNKGQVVGLSGTADGSMHGFLWSRETGMKDIGMVAGDVASVALNLNDKGDVVGISFDKDFNPRAFLRAKGGSPVDLNSLLPAGSPLFLIDACSINARGEIIGIGITESGDAHGYLAAPGSGTGSSSAVDASRFEEARRQLLQRRAQVPRLR